MSCCILYVVLNTWRRHSRRYGVHIIDTPVLWGTLLSQVATTLPYSRIYKSGIGLLLLPSVQSSFTGLSVNASVSFFLVAIPASDAEPRKWAKTQHSIGGLE